MNIGFVLLTHDNPAGAARLVRTLDRMFGDPPVAWHHDFSKCPDLPRDGWPTNTKFVTPHEVTEYCRWPNTRATLRAIEQLYAGPGASRPEWFVLLSGACFPIQPASVIRDHFANATVDAFALHDRIHPDEVTRVWHYECLRRYCERKVKLPWLTKRLLPTWKRVTVRWPDFGRPFFPFSKARPCYAGSQWIAGNARAADSLLKTVRDWPQLSKHYARVWTPEESFIHTAWKSDPALRLENRSPTLAIFERETDQRPKVLTVHDLDQLAGRSELFARKVDDSLAETLARRVV
jgi:hypothetical protein